MINQNPQIVEVLDDTKENVFKARYEIDPKTGKKVIVVEAKCETIIHPDGRKDVIVHAPTLQLINKFLETNK